MIEEVNVNNITEAGKMVIYDCEQTTDEWFSVRAGIPTASNFSAILAKGRGNEESKTRKTYMLKLIGERMTGLIQEGYTNEHMVRGIEMEADARDYYEFMNDVEVKKVGFVLNDGVGCSPDGLIGNNGLVEIKTKLPHLQLEVLLSQRCPPEHIAQIQGQLWVTERDWCDFVSFYAKMPTLIVRVYRDEEYISKLKTEVNQFLSELDELHGQIITKYL